jgi:hypothetical protein
MRVAAKRRLGRAVRQARRQFVESVNCQRSEGACLVGLPGISLAERLAQFQHDLARRNEEGRRDYLRTPITEGG